MSWGRSRRGDSLTVIVLMRKYAVGRVRRDEVVGEERDVLGPLAQGRQLDRDRVDAEIEVLAERARLHRLGEVAVGRRHEPNVHPPRACGAHAKEGAGFQRTQELHLDVRLQLADFVEQERTAVGQLDEPRLRGDGAGERALLVAEELRLEHLARQGATVDGDEGPRGPRRERVDRASHELLPRAALAQDEHRGVGRRDPLDDPENLLHLGTLGEDAAERLGARGVRAQRLVVPEELGLLRGLLDQDVELLDLHGLREVVIGAELHRLDGRGHLLEARHHDHLRLLGEGLELAQDLDPLLLRHPHVEDHDVVRCLREPLERRGAVGDALHVVPLAPELAHHELAQVALVVGDQHADLATHAGSTTRKRLPLPGREVTSIRPP